MGKLLELVNVHIVYSFLAFCGLVNLWIILLFVHHVYNVYENWLIS